MRYPHLGLHGLLLPMLAVAALSGCSTPFAPFSDASAQSPCANSIAAGKQRIVTGPLIYTVQKDFFAAPARPLMASFETQEEIAAESRAGCSK